MSQHNRESEARFGARGRSGDATVVGVFGNRDDAGRAVDELEKNGFSREEISVVTRGDEHGEGRGGKRGESMRMSRGVSGQDLGDGIATGGAIGGLAGLLAGAGALAIPGIGPLVAVGPIAGALTGAVTGGVAGGLIDFGLPEESGRRYEARVREGQIVALIRCDRERASQAADALRRNGALDVETH
jgi:hypothetical protein